MHIIVAVSYNDLFIHLDLDLPMSFHDIKIFHHLNLYKHTHVHFTHDDDYTEYFFGDPAYIGKNMFIMQRLSKVNRSTDMVKRALIA